MKKQTTVIVFGMIALIGNSAMAQSSNMGDRTDPRISVGVPATMPERASRDTVS
jgi:hypothetical protein